MVRLLILRAMCAFLVLSYSTSPLHGQNLQQDARMKPAVVVYQYPLRGERQVSPSTQIGIWIAGNFGDDVLATTKAEAIGSLSGRHSLRSSLARAGSMLILTPNTPFSYDESVTVSYAAGLEDGARIENNFSFTTKKKHIGPMPAVEPEMSETELAPLAALPESISSIGTSIIVTADTSPAPGEIFIANLGLAPAGQLASYLMVLDGHGVLKKSYPLVDTIHHPLDFEKQSTNLLTYYDYELTPDAARQGGIANGKYFGIDTSGNLKDSFDIANPSDTNNLPDGHEFHLFPDGSYARLALEKVDTNLSAIGGDTAAIAESNVIEIFDKTKQLIWQWRGLNYFDIRDAVHVSLNQLSHVIDWQHANSLDFDANGDIILSSRHLSEITKIKGTSGAIMWRLGGAHNQFFLVGDTVWFSYQHAARWLPDGHLTLFDNSNFDSVIGQSGYIHHSRAVEYQLDTVAKTVRLVEQWHHTPEIYSPAMGWVQRLYPSLNTLIGWGFTNPTLTEFHADGSTALELTIGNTDASYRTIWYPVSTSGVVSSTNNPQLALDIIETPGSGVITVAYDLPKPESAHLTIDDVMGREVHAFDAVTQESGLHKMSLRLTGLPSGAYYCVLRTEEGSISRMFNLVR